MSLVLHLTNIHSFEEMNNLIKNAKASINFWGWRHICIPYQGQVDRLPIEALTEKVRNVASEKGFEYTQAERAIGKNITKSSDRLYVESDAVLRRAWCITRIFCYIREYFKERAERKALRIPNLRDKWEVWGSKTFSYYTPRQFQEAFGESPEQAENRGLSLTYLRDPLRYKIREGIEPFIDACGSVGWSSR